MLKPLDIKYAEVEQNNPLRWVVLYQEQDGTLVPQTGLIKCKDFFNDLVGKYYNTSGSIYGFDTKSIKVNEDGVWFLLTNVHVNFQKNVNEFLMPLLDNFEEEIICVSRYEGVLLFIPRCIFSNTYYVSLVTYLIRVCSMSVLHKSLKDVFSLKEEPSIKDTYGHITKWGFTLPEELTKYWFYAGPTLNSETHPDIAHNQISVLHNNGIMGWAYAYQQTPKETECVAPAVISF